MRAAVAVGLAGTILLAGGCGAGAGDDVFPPGSVASPELPASCRTWMGPGVVAVVCDPAREGNAGLSIAADDDESVGQPGLPIGIAQMTADEPFTDGQRVEFRLKGASPHAVAALRAVSRDRTEEAVIAPFDPPARGYEVEIDGRVARVTTDTGRERLVRLGEPDPQVEVKDGSPEQAVRSFVALVSHGEVGWRPACELLAHGTREAYERATHLCEGALGLVLTYDEYNDHPEPESSEVGAVSMREGSDPTIAVVELTHHYRPDRPGQPKRRRATALVALAEENGSWRVLLPNTLSPIAALRDDTTPSEAEIRAQLAKLDG
jgi:hypothetical protein